MRPKGKLFALFAVFAAIGLVTASGAFTTVQAERTVTVDVAGDSSALLQLQGNSTSGNGKYVSGNTSEVTIDFSSDNLGSASGVNQNATTNVSYMLDVTNQGSQSVNFYVSETNNLEFYLNGSTSDSLEGSSNSVTIGSGDKISIGVSIQTDSSGTDFNETVTFHANAQ